MHRFRITHVVQMGTLSDSGDDWWSVPCTVEVEAWSLSEALAKAAELPFEELMADLFKEGDD